MPIRWVALTGTPGVGKTTVAHHLRGLGLDVLDGKTFAHKHGCIIGYDRARRSRIVDEGLVGIVLRQRYKDGKVRFLESHWAHDVPGMDAAIVLRLHPRRLYERLQARQWSKSKIMENVEAECLRLVTNESLQRLGRRRVGELDMTRRTAGGAARRIAFVARDAARRLTQLEIGKADWTEAILEWY